MIATGVDELAPVTGTRGACAALAVPRASHYRHLRGPRHGPPMPRPAPARALSEPERAAVLGELHAPRFVDAAPAAVYATLLDEGTYLASERTMYRILAANAEVRERRDQLRHPAYTKPELLATGPRELFSWIAIRLSSATLSRWQGSRSASTPPRLAPPACWRPLQRSRTTTAAIAGVTLTQHHGMGRLLPAPRSSASVVRNPPG